MQPKSLLSAFVLLARRCWAALNSISGLAKVAPYSMGGAASVPAPDPLAQSAVKVPDIKEQVSMSNSNQVETIMNSGQFEVASRPPSFLRKYYSAQSSFAGLDPQHALRELLEGNQRFILGHSKRPHQSMHRLVQEAMGQTPFAAILTCADSRAPPELMFDQGFGDLFVCRIAGSLATNEQIGSLEYAVWHLGVKVVLVMGHTNCGAVTAAVEGGALPGYIDTLIEQLLVPIERTRYDFGSKDVSDQIDAITRHNVAYQVERILKSNVINNKVQANDCMVVGGVYDIKSGVVTLLE